VDISSVPTGIPVKGERVITAALAAAEKALEGTGGIPDSDDEGVVIMDLINSCTYAVE